MGVAEQLAGSLENVVSSLIGPKTVSDKTLHTPRVRQAVVNAVKPGAWQKVGGVPLAARVLHHLGKAGIEEAVLLLSARHSSEELGRWKGDVRLRPLDVDETGERTASVIRSLRWSDRSFLYIDAAHIIDPRIIRSLAAASEATLAFIDQEDRGKSRIRAGLLDPASLDVWVEEGDAALVRHAGAVYPKELDPSNPEIRGATVPYFYQVDESADAERATDILIRSSQNQVMDLPAKYLDPPLENALTALLCDTPVTPNMVTLAGLAVAAVVASLFWHGYFVLGALLSFVVEILDGVDGKLARTKLIYSKLGQREDLIDYFYETSWYVSLGVGLSTLSHDEAWPFVLAALMVVCDTTDNILYTLAAKWHGKSIDLFSAWDGAFRLIAGRRNIYTAMFIIGFSMGYPMRTFALAALWAALTATVHAARLVQYGKSQAVRI